MLTILLGLFSSTGMGAIIGALGGLANRWMDMKSKALDLLDKKDARAHELLLRTKDLEQLDKEIAGHAQVASIEGEARIETSAYDAMAKSYENDKATYGIKSIDMARGLVRPVITVIFLVIVCYINYRVWQLFDEKGVVLTAEQAFEIIRWTLFEASVVIGWWFASRPTGNAGLKLKNTESTLDVGG